MIELKKNPSILLNKGKNFLNEFLISVIYFKIYVIIY